MANEADTVKQQQTKPIKIGKWKVRQGNTVSVGRIVLLYDFPDAEKPEQRKLKASQAGIIHKILAEAGSLVQPGEPLYEIKACSHPTIMNDMCAECGADLRKDDIPKTTASVPMIHAIPDLKVSEEQAQKLGQADNDRLIKDRKLVLLVDLDQTLIHTTNDNIPPNIKDVYHFQLYGPNSPWYHTRLRPGTHKFLTSIGNFYELHICTFGARNYAHTIAMFLDPDQTFFSSRILSRDECFDPTSKKANLRALFPCGDDMVCIIDDREDVWSHALNLIHVKPYHFFQHTGDINAPPGLDKHETDDKEGLDLTKMVKEIESHNKEKKNREEANASSEEKGDTKVNSTTSPKEAESNNSSEDGVMQEEIVNSETKVSEVNKPNEDSVLEEKTVEADSAQVEKSVELDSAQVEKSVESDDCAQAEKSFELDSAQVKESVESVNSAQPEKCVELDNAPVESQKDESNKPDEIAKEGSTSNNVTDSNCEATEKTKDESDEKMGPTENKEPDNEKTLVKSDGDNNNGKLKSVSTQPEENMIEIEDSDDYIIYLEDILKRIHNTYYELYDKMEAGKIPDLKKVIPFVKSRVLNGCKLVFSGLVPTHYKLEQSKAYQVARSLGAEVQMDFEDDTTHLVALKPGTAKVNAGRRKKHLKIVTPDWLWCCAERWDHADERIFPLNAKGSKNRHPPPHCSSPEHVVAYPEHDTPALRKRTPSGRFMDTINPLMSFSSDDIADMDKEVEDILDDESDDSDEEQTAANQVDNEEDESDTDIEEVNFKHMVQTEILDAYVEQQEDDGEREPTKESEDSEEDEEENKINDFHLQIKRQKRKRRLETDEEDTQEELPSRKFRRGEDLDDLDDMNPDRDPDDNDSNSFEAPEEDDDGEWNMMGAALEREFLSD